MLKIRLKRVGRKHDPSFRVVLVDSQKGPQTGKINEILGFYDPRNDVRELKADRIQHWISNGAQVSDTVHNILVTEKVIDGKKINVLPKKSPIIKEGEEKAPEVVEAPKKDGNEAPEEVAEEVQTEAPVEESKEEIKEEAPAEEEVKEETSVEEKTEEKEQPEGEVGEDQPKADQPGAGK